MSFITRKTGETKTVEVEQTVELCDICKSEIADVYPYFSVEVQKERPPCYENDGEDGWWFYSICSPACLRKVADKFE